MTRRRLFRPEEGGVGAGLDVGALAPMVDMMTLLLVFMLRSYATEPAPAPPVADFALAGTVSEDPRSRAVEVLVAGDGVWVDGRRLATLTAGDPEVLVRPLYEALLKLRGPRRVEVHADHRVSYAMLRRILYTARAAEYDEIALVAVNRASL